MISNPCISVIIVNYNGGEWLTRCVQSVADQSLTDFECFIVDNGSTDGSIAALPKLDERFTIMELGENTGFAKGNNIAARQAKGEWLALLNPDAFARVDWLEKLMGATNLTPNVTMVGSTQYMALEPDIYDGVGDFYHAAGLAWRGKHGHSAAGHSPKTAEVFGPCAAAALYHRETFERLGGFDERFFCYHEDVDIAFRFRLAGGVCVQKADAIVDHVSSGISGKASPFAVYHGTRNRIWTFVKCMPLLGLLVFGPAHIALNLAFMTWSLFRKGRAKPTWRGVRDGIKGIPIMWTARKNLERKVGLGSLLHVMTLNPLKFLNRGDGSVPIRK
ncbi:glycosyltransferase family 2 protein [Hellea balneolensis]|uniref:glycosyltransferase family 2 protein n=1 Tax=Hellea balneolensis TaxID=287478 RepID=UPI000411D378|nr:glycosyltransferase family 2 protein [Hellea balneolensis]